jgi:glucose-1-phosphate thymidylyltransferase
METKGILLAGGSGTRLGLLSRVVNKQLLPVYDKPMIYYPLATLMTAGIRDICIVVNPNEKLLFQRVLGDGRQYGINIQYATQIKPEGLPQALKICEEFIGTSNVCMVLGDNIFVGSGLGRSLRKISIIGAHIFLYHVESPQNYGNVELGSSGNILQVVEKPINPFSNYVIPGLYFFDNTVVGRASGLLKSPRGEFEIVDLINQYLEESKLDYTTLSRGTVWLDAGNPEDLFSASEYVRMIQSRQGIYVACLEEIAIRNGWLSISELKNMEIMKVKSSYTDYLTKICQEGIQIEPSFK